jgi:hypothetical protein
VAVLVVATANKMSSSARCGQTPRKAWAAKCDEHRYHRRRRPPCCGPEKPITNNNRTTRNKQDSKGGKLELYSSVRNCKPLYICGSASLYTATDRLLHFENGLIWKKSFQDVLKLTREFTSRSSHDPHLVETRNANAPHLQVKARAVVG